jgi:hypothetical protein
LEKGKEPAAKDADEEPLFDDNKFAAELLRTALRKLEGVGEAFNIKVHLDAYKDPTLKGLSFRIPWSTGLPAATSSSTTAAPTATTAATAMTAATTAAKAVTAGLQLIDRLLYQLVTIMSVCFCVFVRFLDMN